MTNKPLIFAVSAIAFIVIPFLVFILYDQKVSRQQNEIISSAKRSNAIVSSLFPSHIRDQLINTMTSTTVGTGKSLKESGKALLFSSAPPIAELYPEATVLFAGKYNDVSILEVYTSLTTPSNSCNINHRYCILYCMVFR